MIIRWISDVPSKIVKLVGVRSVSAGQWPARTGDVSTNSARTWTILSNRLPSPTSGLRVDEAITELLEGNCRTASTIAPYPAGRGEDRDDSAINTAR